MNRSHGCIRKICNPQSQQRRRTCCLQRRWIHWPLAAAVADGVVSSHTLRWTNLVRKKQTKNFPVFTCLSWKRWWCLDGDPAIITQIQRKRMLWKQLHGHRSLSDTRLKWCIHTGRTHACTRMHTHTHINICRYIYTVYTNTCMHRLVLSSVFSVCVMCCCGSTPGSNHSWHPCFQLAANKEAAFFFPPHSRKNSLTFSHVSLSALSLALRRRTKRCLFLDSAALEIWRTNHHCLE